ncbi:unnamed protein product [Brassica oleracea var. botrytis]
MKIAGPRADPHTRCYRAGRDWSYVSETAARRGTTRRDSNETEPATGQVIWLRESPNATTNWGFASSRENIFLQVK